MQRVQQVQASAASATSASKCMLGICGIPSQVNNKRFHQDEVTSVPPIQRTKGQQQVQ
ncbi:MAG: hypothetical protein ACREBR_01835 [bacterium]